jgi:hypothetical protein
MLPALLAALSGCVFYPSHVEYDDLTINEPYDRIVVEVDAGDVRMIGEDTSSTEVHMVLTFGRSRPELLWYMDGDTLFLDGECPRIGSCEISLDISLPADVTAEVETGAGDVEIEELTGSLDLETGAGDISGTGLTGGVFFADTGAGDVSLSCATAPELVDVDSGAGDIDLRVPADTYRIETDSGVGDVVITGLTLDEHADRVIKASTGAGDITIIGR